MREVLLLRKTLTILISISLLFVFMVLPENASLAATGKDYVLVIDISTSMQDIFDEVKEQAKSAIDRARTGDNIALITFGEQTTLLDRRVIHSKADIEALKAVIDDLYPTDYATYISRGLEKGLSELRYLFERAPDRERVLLWLSDNKDNPPDMLGEEFLTLDEVREQNRSFEPGNEWFTYDAPLEKEVENKALEEFVTWARRTTFRVVIKEPSVDLGSSEETTIEKQVVLTFEPRDSAAEGRVFTAEAYLINPNDPTQTLPVTLSPRRIVASRDSWQQEFQIAFAGEPGQYEGSLRFKPAAGESLDVEPRNVPLTATIIPPKLAAVELEEPAKPEAGGLLGDAKEKGIIATEKRPPGSTRIEKPINFGPLDPGKKDSKIITLFLNQEADTKTITLDSSINLPEGVDIKSEVYGSGTKIAAEITVSVDRNVQLAEDFVLQEAYEGSVRFKSTEPGVEVLPLYVPIRVSFITDKVRWGRKLLPKTDVGQFKARGMTFEELAKELEDSEKQTDEEAGGIRSVLRNVYTNVMSRLLLFVLLAVVVSFIAVMLYRMRPASELFEGELVVIKDPSDSNMKNVNLKRTGSLQDKNILTLGSSPKADIRLPHGTVSPIHCRLSAKAGDNRTVIAIHPIKGFPVKVNDIELSEKNFLSDKDLIGIGDFILLFSNPEAQKEVVVHFHDGQTMKGTPVTWDIKASSFELLRGDTENLQEAEDEIAVVDFDNLKAVFFLQQVSGGTGGIPKERINTAETLEVIFFDGEKVEGNPLTDYSETAQRFYLIPKEMPNIGSILVERKSVKSVTRKAQGEKK